MSHVGLCVSVTGHGPQGQYLILNLFGASEVGICAPQSGTAPRPERAYEYGFEPLTLLFMDLRCDNLILRPSVKVITDPE